MLESNDTAYLKRVLEKNELVLFLGAGFSREAINISNKEIPVGQKFGEILSNYLESKDKPDSYNLQRLFEVALNFRKGQEQLKNLLEKCFIVKDAPIWYDFLTKFYFFRIYSTNVDDLVEFVFKRSKNEIQSLDKIIAPTQDYKERDQLLDPFST